jgi:2Fe-2S ferredoxin
MIKIIFKLPDQTIIAEGVLGESLMALAKRYHIKQIKGSCGGKLSCASCHLLIDTPGEARSQREEDLLYSLAEPYPLENSRLSCQVILTKNLNNSIVTIV